MLVKGADWFVEGTAGIARKFGIPQLVIGLTIVAMGTSAPEAAVSITAALKNNAGISIGNVVGSNILNILIILGISAVIVALAIQESTIKYETPYMIFVTIVLLVMGYTGGTVTRLEGVILWVLFILYLAYLFRLAKNNKEEDTEESRSPLFLLINAIVGSNIFNILFVIGTASLITPIPFASNFLIDAIIAILAGVLLWISVFRTKKLTRPWGIVMLICYAAYFVYLL